MKEIQLTRGCVALVDDEDYELLNKYKWHFMTVGYAGRSFYINKNKSRILYMHRVILDAKTEQYVDHINGNKLDNRRSNLRICTQSQNCSNSKKSKSKISSKYKGVWKRNDGRSKCWVAEHMLNRKKLYIGSFYSEEEARNAYDSFVLNLRKEFARPNE